MAQSNRDQSPTTLAPAAPDVLDVVECATLLRVHEQTVRNLYRAEGLPFHPLGSGKTAPVRFIRAEVIDWLKSRCIASDPGQPGSQSREVAA